MGQTEIQLAFVASCVEFLAEMLKRPYLEIYNRMKRVGMIEGYLMPCYDTLHTESRENITEVVYKCLTNWEAKKNVN